MEARLGRVVPLVVAIALLGSGCTQEVDEPRPFASSEEIATSSEKIDIGGRTLFLQCWGEPVGDEPTVLLMAGQGPSTSSWQSMARELAAEGHHLCAYDRAGVGGSEPASEVTRTTEDQVDDLVALLDAADLQEPIVLAAHSLGSLPVVGFVSRAPERVAGVVLIDPWSPHVVAARRAALPPEQADESAVLAEDRRFLTDYVFDPMQNSERLLIDVSDQQVNVLLEKPGPIFGDLPVIVLAQPLPPPIPEMPDAFHRASIAAYSAGYQEFVDETTSGTLIEVQDTGHDIHVDQPDVVMDAIRDVLSG